MTPRARILLMWCVLGHQDHDEMKGGKCGTCGASLNDWTEKIIKQHGARPEDCCKGYTIGIDHSSEVNRPKQ